MAGRQIILGMLFFMASATQAAKVTPMEKVIGLLKGLSAKVTAEGAKEAAQYDKFACFCKEQADEKLYAIEKSEAKIADLKAEIKELNAAISTLNGDIGDLSKKITGLDGDIKRKTKARAKDRAAYEVKEKDMNEAIDACAAAIEALKDSKGAMSGAKLDLLQAAGAKVAKSTSVVALLAKAAPKFEYQSNDIISTLEDLLATFKSMKKELDITEFDGSSAFQREKLSLSNDKKFSEKDRAEKESVVEAKTEDMEAAKSDRDDETNEMNADQEFLDQVTIECENKAHLFDQRSQLRSEEITVLSEATAELEKGAVPNFSSNKKLVGLVQKKNPLAKAVSFVQISNVQHEQSNKEAAKREAALRRVRQFLTSKADSTDSRALSAIAVRIGVAEDHFVKVRALIKDLILKLREDAKAEATQKGMCDKGMSKAISDRDEANAKIEVANAKITTLTAKQNALEDEIETLTGDIAELKKALLEATELRADDKAENTETMTMSQEGADSVELALNMLKKFYENAFAQVGSKYTPPNADRDGNTVGDLAPDFAEEKYHGSQSESKGIVGILEVILSDFQRSNKDAAQDEKDGKKAFDKFEKDTNDDVDKKEKRIKKAAGEVSAAKSDILDQEQDLNDANDLLESAQESLESLEVMCVKGEETWEERKKKREEEIEALKDALTILEEWQA